LRDQHAERVPERGGGVRQQVVTIGGECRGAKPFLSI
jgi:hypothetical protein